MPDQGAWLRPHLGVMVVPSLLGEDATPVQVLALRIIEGIERNGHFQGEDFNSWSPDNQSAPCCIVANPAYGHGFPGGVREDFKRQFRSAAGVERGGGGESVITVNDALSTDEVLDALWAVALG